MVGKEGSGRAGWENPSGSLANVAGKRLVPGIAAAPPLTHLSTTPFLHDDNRAFVMDMLPQHHYDSWQFRPVNVPAVRWSNTARRK